MISYPEQNSLQDNTGWGYRDNIKKEFEMFFQFQPQKQLAIQTLNNFSSQLYKVSEYTFEQNLNLIIIVDYMGEEIGSAYKK